MEVLWLKDLADIGDAYMKTEAILCSDEMVFSSGGFIFMEMFEKMSNFLGISSKTGGERKMNFSPVALKRNNILFTKWKHKI